MKLFLAIIASILLFGASALGTVGGSRETCLSESDTIHNLYHRSAKERMYQRISIKEKKPNLIFPQVGNVQGKECYLGTEYAEFFVDGREIHIRCNTLDEFWHRRMYAYFECELPPEKAYYAAKRGLFEITTPCADVAKIVEIEPTTQDQVDIWTCGVSRFFETPEERNKYVKGYIISSDCADIKAHNDQIADRLKMKASTKWW